MLEIKNQDRKKEESELFIILESPNNYHCGAPLGIKLVLQIWLYPKAKSHNFISPVFAHIYILQYYTNRYTFTLILLVLYH